MSQNNSGPIETHGERAIVGSQFNTAGGSVYFGDVPESRSQPCFIIPFPRDTGFIDRGDLLDQVDQECSLPMGKAALVGLGGVGKSQIAIEYCYRVHERSPETWIFWVHAGTVARFEEDYQKIANALKIPGRDDPKNLLASVRNTLESDTIIRWLMVLDNADDHTILLPQKHQQSNETQIDQQSSGVEPLISFVPQSAQGNILVTSRSKDVAQRLGGGPGGTISVDIMDEAEALKLLRKKVSRDSSANVDGDKELLQELDYVPLAISQAAAFICQRSPRMSTVKYLDMLRRNERSQLRLLEQDMGDERRDGRSALSSIIATWQISFDQIRANRKSASELLSLMSLFDRQGIPRNLLAGAQGKDLNHPQDIYGYFEKEEDDLEDDNSEAEDDLEDDIDLLRRYSLIAANVKDDSFEMHRLVQLATRSWLETQHEIEKFRRRYAAILNTKFPNAELKNWPTCQKLLPHAVAMMRQMPSGENSRDIRLRWASVVVKVGRYQIEMGAYGTAMETIRKALAILQDLLGADHLITLKSMMNLSIALEYQGKYEDAEAVIKKVIQGREKALGAEHLETLGSLDEFAMILQGQGKYEEAEGVSKIILQKKEKIFGAEHRSTRLTMNNLAVLLANQHKFEEAKVMSKRALQGRGMEPGDEDPDMLTGIANLAVILADQGKDEEAEAMHRKVLRGKEKVLGAEHPSTLRSISHLGGLLVHQRKYEEAEVILQGVIETQEKVIGIEHPDTLIDISNLATLKIFQHKYKEAEIIFQELIPMREKVLGSEHLHTLLNMSQLAALKSCRGKNEEAEVMYRRVIRGLKKVPGAGDPYTPGIAASLARILENQGRFEEAATVRWGETPLQEDDSQSSMQNAKRMWSYPSYSLPCEDANLPADSRRQSI